MSHENNTIQNRQIKAVWWRPLVVIFRFKPTLLFKKTFPYSQNKTCFEEVNYRR